MKRNLRMVEGWFFLNIYMPLFRPRLWLAHRRACQQLLEDIGWIDLDF